MTGKPLSLWEDTYDIPALWALPKAGIRTNAGPVQSGVRAHSTASADTGVGQHSPLGASQLNSLQQDSV